MARSSSQNLLWSVVLAGGEGERLKPLVQRWMGHHLPKQYCAFIGTRSMFQHTIDRADELASPRQRVIVIGRSHWNHVSRQLGMRHGGKIISQPANRETAVGIYLAIAFIHRVHPKAQLVVYPSDHFIYPETKFLKAVRSLVEASHRMSGRLCLLGVAPDAEDLEYGFIQPASCQIEIARQRVHSVDAFLEKPSLQEYQSALRSGVLWNTLVFTAGAKVLWEMGWQAFPSVMSLLEKYQKVIGTPQEETILSAIYPRIPALGFSKHLLEKSVDQISVMELKDVLWSDWGRQERILSTLRQIGRRPAFLQANSASA